MHSFEANIELIGINPFVFVPMDILHQIFIAAGKDKGFIPVHGLINNKAYTQTLVRYQGEWRLYINTIMLKNSPKRIGEKITLSIAYDPKPRTIAMPIKFKDALTKNLEAKKVFDALSPTRQNEIVRYLARLKNEEILHKNIDRAINFLLGKERFVGRAKP